MDSMRASFGRMPSNVSDRQTKPRCRGDNGDDRAGTAGSLKMSSWVSDWLQVPWFVGDDEIGTPAVRSEKRSLNLSGIMASMAH